MKNNQTTEVTDVAIVMHFTIATYRTLGREVDSFNADWRPEVFKVLSRAIGRFNLMVKAIPTGVFGGIAPHVIDSLANEFGKYLSSDYLTRKGAPVPWKYTSITDDGLVDVFINYFIPDESKLCKSFFRLLLQSALTAHDRTQQQS